MEGIKEVYNDLGMPDIGNQMVNSLAKTQKLTKLTGFDQSHLGQTKDDTAAPATTAAEIPSATPSPV